jgi:hypothetical protein
MSNLLDTYTPSAPINFDNKVILDDVAASVGDVILVGVTGRRAAAVITFTAPTWNGEAFSAVDEITGNNPIGLQVFRLKCASAGTFDIQINADDFGPLNGIALVYSGTFGDSYTAGVQRAAWTGSVAYSLPSVDVADVGAGDIVVNFLSALGENDGFSDVSSVLHISNGTQRALSENESTISKRLYAATNTGTGSVTAAYSTSDEEEHPMYRMVAFRLFEEAESAIDSYPETVRSGQTGIDYETSGLTSVTSILIGDLEADSISDSSGVGTHSMPGLTDETEHELFGIKTVTFNGSLTTNTIFLPPEGYDFVELGDDINDTETGAVFEFDPVAVEGDQLAKPESLGIDEHADILGDDGAYTVWHIQASTKIARSYILTLGPPGDNPAVMPADTSVNVAENTTAVGTFAASSGSSPITYSVGGTDAALFSINSSTGVVAFLSAPNFESGSNTKNIIVTATNAHGNDSQNITVNVTNVVEAPVMPADRARTVIEGKTIVGNTGASFVDGSITYTKSGTNHALFNINASTGALTFISPAVIGDYSVTVTATNSAGNDAQNLTINVIAASAKTNHFQAKFF